MRAPRLAAALALALTLWALALGCSAALAAVSPEDVASTHAYLAAVYTYDLTAAANAATSKAAYEGLANTIGGECAGVLKGAPPQRFGGAGGHLPLTARGIGEARRRQRQLDRLRSELDEALALAYIQPDRQAALTLAGTVASLHWSNPTITRLANGLATERVRVLELAPPSVCADLRAWVMSGYKTLSPATKQLFSSLSALHAGLERATLDRLLSTEEGPAEKLLQKQTDQLIQQIGTTLATLSELPQRLQRTLGFPVRPFEEEPQAPAKHSVKIGQGRTAVGGHYTVSAEIVRPGNGLGPGCRGNVEIETKGSGGVSGSGGCLGSGAHAEASVNCEEGLLSIHANTLPRTRSVILHLSDGRRIRSLAVSVPKRYGGPGGLYYQVVRGPLPIPVSLTELDAHGRKLRADALPHIHECTKPALRYLPGGLRTLVHDSVPGGPAFSILAKHYRFLGHVYFEVDLNVKPLAGIEGADEYGLGGEGVSLIAIGNSIAHQHGLKPSPFSPHFQNSCEPHPYAILYGLLKPPGASVLARVSGNLEELHHVPIPANMHAGGTLIYGVLPTIPEELIVRSAKGKTIFSEELGQAGKEALETCEGEAES